MNVTFFVIERYVEKIQSEAKGLFNEHSQTLREELGIKFSHSLSYFQVWNNFFIF
jgi:hypothetical protein